MLRLQQYERLMKTLLTHHELAGPAGTLEAQRAANLEKVSDKTLGTLVKSLFEIVPTCSGHSDTTFDKNSAPTRAPEGSSSVGVRKVFRTISTLATTLLVSRRARATRSSVRMQMKS